MTINLLLSNQFHQY